MSIQTLREQGLPGITMRYEEGGKVQVFMMNGKEVRFGPEIVTAEQLKVAFKEAE
jgi:hypothetical protein